MTRPAVVVGAGPAGLACARELTTAGCPVVLIDDNLQAGGQYFRQLPPGYRATKTAALLSDTGRAPALFEVLSHPLISYRPGTVAWAIQDPLTVSYAGPKGSGRVRARALVLATGCQDRPMPFPGWTLPGVISAGGCLNLAKGHGVVPEGRVVVAGNGPLVLVVSAMLAAAGCNLTHLVEAAPDQRLVAGLGSGLLQSPGLLLKGLGYRARLFRGGVRFLSGQMVSRAVGADAVTAVEVAPVAANGEPDRSRPKQLKVDTLVVGYGLMPGSEFARMLDCKMAFDPELGGWVPLRSDRFETSRPSVYAVGDGAGIGGVEIALLEGRLAGDAILRREPDPSAMRRYRQLDRFRHALARAYRMPEPLKAADAGTIVCRCEELRLADLEHFAMAEPDLGRIKATSRLGMGRCQGRNCLTSAATLLGLGEDTTGSLPRMRPPARPVRIAHLVADSDTGPARVPDEFAAESPVPNDHT